MQKAVGVHFLKKKSTFMGRAAMVLEALATYSPGDKTAVLAQDIMIWKRIISQGFLCSSVNVVTDLRRRSYMKSTFGFRFWISRLDEESPIEVIMDLVKDPPILSCDGDTAFKKKVA
jgi:hypothetical protein